MKGSDRQLMGEDQLNEEVAEALLTDRDLASQLEELASVVEDHDEFDDGVLADVDAGRLTGPWIAAWPEGIAAFERPKADWLVFLCTWNRIAIDRDRQGFLQAAHAMLGRLRERLEMETRAFYATALQTGMIDLR